MSEIAEKLAEAARKVEERGLGEAPAEPKWVKEQQEQFIQVSTVHYKGEIRYTALDRTGNVWYYDHVGHMWRRFPMLKEESE